MWHAKMSVLAFPGSRDAIDSGSSHPVCLDTGARPHVLVFVCAPCSTCCLRVAPRSCLHLVHRAQPCAPADVDPPPDGAPLLRRLPPPWPRARGRERGHHVLRRVALSCRRMPQPPPPSPPEVGQARATAGRSASRRARGLTSETPRQPRGPWSAQAFLKNSSETQLQYRKRTQLGMSTGTMRLKKCPSLAARAGLPCCLGCPSRCPRAARLPSRPAARLPGCLAAWLSSCLGWAGQHSDQTAGRPPLASDGADRLARQPTESPYALKVHSGVILEKYPK